MSSNILSIYTAGPIDLVDSQINWRSKLQAEAENDGYSWVLYNPATSFMSSNWGKIAPERARYIEEVNTAALSQADIFVAVVPGKQFSMGVPIEIEHAVNTYNRPVYIISDIKPGRSAYLDNRVPTSRWVVVESWGEEDIEMACTTLVNIIVNDEAI